MSSNVTCSIQIMSNTHADTCFNALMSIINQLSENTFEKVTT